MGIALVSPVGSNGRRASAMCRVILLSGATAVAVAAPILVSFRHRSPAVTTVITGDPASLPDEVGAGPLLDRRWVPQAASHPLEDLFAGATSTIGGSHGVGASGESTSKAAGGGPDRDQGSSNEAACRSCEMDPAGFDEDQTDAERDQEAAPAPITVVYPTTTRPGRVSPTATTVAAAGASSTTASSSSTTADIPSGSSSSTAAPSSVPTTTTITTTTASATTTAPGPETLVLPAVPDGGDVVDHRLEFSGGILWLRVSPTGLTLLDVVAKAPFGVDNVNSDQTQVQVRFRSDAARQEILADFQSDGRTKVTVTNGSLI
ncbi:MAG: hypothetical protein ACKV2O_13410 [Acidimicrobiales bacterium]